MRFYHTSLQPYLFGENMAVWVVESLYLSLAFNIPATISFMSLRLSLSRIPILKALSTICMTVSTFTSIFIHLTINSLSSSLKLADYQQTAVPHIYGLLQGRRREIAYKPLFLSQYHLSRYCNHIVCRSSHIPYVQTCHWLY